MCGAQPRHSATEQQAAQTLPSLNAKAKGELTEAPFSKMGQAGKNPVKVKAADLNWLLGI